MVCDGCQRVGEPGLRIDAIELGRFDQGKGDGGCFSATLRTHEQIVFSAQGNRSHGSLGALYEAFAPAEARRILRRLEFHYTPKHASWLNMVEIEIGVLRGQCLDRRIDDPTRLISEIAAWERQRNVVAARIKWMFTTDKARAKMGRAYPVTSKES